DGSSPRSSSSMRSRSASPRCRRGATRSVPRGKPRTKRHASRPSTATCPAIPTPPRTELRALLRDYTRFVIEEEWPVQRGGEIPEGGNAVLEGFGQALFSFAPATDEQRILYAEALRTYNQLLEERRERLEAVEYAVPGELWGVVIAGAIISLAASWVFRLESLALHGLMTGLLSAMVGVVVFFIATIDRPYRGKDSVTPFAYEILLHDLMGKETPRLP